MSTKRWNSYEEYSLFLGSVTRAEAWSLALACQRQHIPSTVNSRLVRNPSFNEQQSCRCGFHLLTWAFPLRLQHISWFRPTWPSLPTAARNLCPVDIFLQPNRTPAKLPHPAYSRLLHLNKLYSYARFFPIETTLFIFPHCVHCKPVCRVTTNELASRYSVLRCVVHLLPSTTWIFWKHFCGHFHLHKVRFKYMKRKQTRR